MSTVETIKLQFSQLPVEQKVGIRDGGRPLPALTGLQQAVKVKNRSTLRKFNPQYYEKLDWLCGCEMSLLPSLLNELIDDMSNLNRPTRYMLGDIYDQHFGLGLNDLPTTRLTPHHLPALRAGYIRPWRSLAPPESGISTVSTTDNEFSVKLDVSHFKPEELKVHVAEGNYIVIEGKHEERVDEHGTISRQFTRKYKLPETADLDTLASNISSDGVLSIVAAKKAPQVAGGREIRIIQTHQPALLTQTSTNERKVDIVKEEPSTGKSESTEK